MSYRHNDGGRKAAGFKGTARDCVARALAIAADLPYTEAYRLLSEANARRGNAKSARDGVDKAVYCEVFAALGWVWNAAPQFVGRRARPRDIHFAGMVIARQAGHLVAVNCGVCEDIFDSSEKMVYGYWSKKVLRK